MRGHDDAPHAVSQSIALIESRMSDLTGPHSFKRFRKRRPSLVTPTGPASDHLAVWKVCIVCRRRIYWWAIVFIVAPPTETLGTICKVMDGANGTNHELTHCTRSPIMERLSR